MTQYTGNYIYNGPPGSETLQFMSQPEGYVTPNGQGGYDYVYRYRDHLGNIRLSYQDIDKDGSVDSSEIMDEKNYYPVILPENWTIRLVKKLKFKFNQDYERKTQKIQFAVQGKCCH